MAGIQSSVSSSKNGIGASRSEVSLDRKGDDVNEDSSHRRVSSPWEGSYMPALLKPAKAPSTSKHGVRDGIVGVKGPPQG